jgi:outer membrane receptor for ferrienterochelin and colicins
MNANNTPIAIALLGAIHCGSAVAITMEDEEMTAFLAMLDQETAIATQNKMNAAYVPGMVSVLHGDDLAEQGVRTLADALNKVAGFHVLHNNNGDVVTLVRGIGSTLNGSNVKLLLNGVAVNRPSDASADWMMRFPVDQIERIEVIRGPGSVLYGEYAFAGVVNVITRQDQTIGVTTGHDGFRQGDFITTQEWQSGLKLSANLSFRQQDASGLFTNADNFILDGGYSPAPVNDQEEGRILLLKAEYQGYQLAIQHANVERGGWYGRNAAMPYAMEPRQETANNLQLGKEWIVDERLSVDLSLIQRDDELLDATFLPIIGGLQRPGGGPNNSTTVERFVRDGVEMQTRQASVKVHWRASDSHTMFFATDVSRSEIEDSYRKARLKGQPLTESPSNNVAVTSGATRLNKSVTAQDEWRAGERLTLTMGARFDDYDDWGSHTTPRLAAVWQLNEAHLLKMQYSEAFRPPTMVEAFSPSDGLTGDSGRYLRPENLDSTEMAYIYRMPGSSLRATIFKTDVVDLIEYFQKPGSQARWRNHSQIDTRGAEVEFKQQWDRNWSWFANLSYVSAKEQTDDGDGIPTGSIEWLGNAGVTWRSDRLGVHSLSLNYSGTQEGFDLTLRQDVTHRFPVVGLLDYSLTLHDLMGVAGLQANLTVNNVLDKAYNVVPSQLQYPLGLPEVRRRLVAGLQYSF